MGRFITSVTLWILASPVFFVIGVRRMLRRQRFWRMAFRATIPCETCGASVSLLGLWECRCGYTYRGHVLRQCPICHGLPRMVRCYSCGATELLPEP